MLHRLWNDHLNVADLCVIWGNNARELELNLDSTLVGKASDAQRSAASGSPLALQERSRTDIGYRDFVVSCGSGLQTAIVGIIEDRDQEIAPTGCFYLTSHY